MVDAVGVVVVKAERDVPLGDRNLIPAVPYSCTVSKMAGDEAPAVARFGA
jgi:hypothetical protein